MSLISREELLGKKCVPCEGGVPPLDAKEVDGLVKNLPGWHADHNHTRIKREWRAKNFMTAIEFFNKVAALAEAEGHHPDLHLTGYRTVEIELWTHAVGGVTENDFILAAKIDEIPIALKKGP
jgi:4a-hydroxytetrahydrobiopterin dehydratase